MGASWSQLGSSRGSLEPNLAPLGSNLELLGSLWNSTWPFQLASKRNLDSTGPLQFASKYQLDSTWPFQLASQRHLDSTATASIAIRVLSTCPSSALQVYSKCAPVGIPQGLSLPTQLPRRGAIHMCVQSRSDPNNRLRRHLALQNSLPSELQLAHALDVLTVICTSIRTSTTAVSSNEASFELPKQLPIPTIHRCLSTPC